ncbi:MAG: primosomal protein N' [Alistipes sp.]|nr:primosomal protein N' [Alistipes sp.]
MNRYADIVLPLWQPLYTFAVPDDCKVVEGDAVAVQFGSGSRSIFTGVVWRLHDRRPEAGKIKPVIRTLYDRPLLTQQQMRFWEWMADYYMCTLGEVMRFALPSMIKPRGAGEEEFGREEFKPRMTSFVVAGVTPTVEEFAKLRRRAPRQAELLEAVSSAGGIARGKCGEAALSALLKKGFLRLELREAECRDSQAATDGMPALTEAQSKAAEEIRRGWESNDTVLLHGVSGSGKTEIYMHLAAEIIAAGGDVLMLVPEIALTTQLVSRIRRIFGERVTPYHSKLTARQRTETYLRLNGSAGGNFVVGARSALFLPLHGLRLVIVDEEHDSGYRQTEPPPRYHGRDAALMLARICGAKSLLGSATPSLESYMRACTGKYARVLLGERYGGGEAPRIVISDTVRAVKRNERRSHFNKEVIDAVADRLERGEQILLFQNRRGYSPYTSCSHCGRTIRCPHCNVTMSLHGGNRLVCHYCGRTERKPLRCPACNAGEVVPMGFGTEKIEAEISALFPAARVLRLDRDSAPSQSACERILDSFARGDADILVGTQIITKGLDFDRVTLAVVLNADNLLNAPDYRAAERAFQTVMQFAGRGGRRNVRGEVIIQTSEPEHPVLQQASRYDYEGMVRMQLAERRMFHYPPYARVTAVTLRHPDAAVLHAAAGDTAAALRERFSKRVFGPSVPAAERIRNEFVAEVVVKIESGASFSRARAILSETVAAVMSRPEYKNLTIFCNVDI